MTLEPNPATLTEERAANLAENPFAGQGPVLLDIGGDIGAIVLRLPASMHGAEIEIHRVGGEQRTHQHDHAHPHGHDHGHPHSHDHGQDGHHHEHVAVVARPSADGTQYSAVFPEVETGSYDLREAGGSVTVRVDVTGGAVTEADWP